VTPEDSDPRRIAWETLNAVEDGAFADAELGRRLAKSTLAPRDRALATRLVYGTLAWQAYLDHILGRLRRPAPALDVPLRTLLRMALLQLTKLSRVPEFAAVDTAVDLSKEFRRGAASGLVNALLRRFLRQDKSVPLPPENNLVDHLSIKLSHPAWLVERCLRQLGREETEAVLAANNDAAPTVLRVNRLRTDRDSVVHELEQRGIATRPTTAPDGLELGSAVDVASLPGFAAGRFTLQGEASQLVSLLLGVSPGHSVLDVCSAPGGKATQLAESVGKMGRVIAIDRSGGGIAQVRRNALRLGLSRLFPVRADSRALPLRESVPFDAVLVDAPCSGFGTLRQHPEIRWRRSAQNVSELAALQSQLLDAVAGLVKSEGVLVYATCTVVREENDDVVAAFLDRHDDFRVDAVATNLPEAVRRFIDANGFLRTWPQRDGLDGFFAARLRKRG
jgi:16S rRNA (cytosine967-C5)-methyltransferase